MSKPERVSLTTFVDFVSKAGTPKITVVKQLKHGEEYQPAFDFYKRVREGIVDLHETGKPKKTLDELLAALTDAKKAEHYRAVVKGHKKFIGKRTMAWFQPPGATWTGGGIDISVNPELGLEIDGVRHVVKLYFKPPPLPKNRVAIITRLMQQSLAPALGATFAVLDVRRGALHAPVAGAPGLDALLLGEAATFAGILSSI